MNDDTEVMDERQGIPARTPDENYSSSTVMSPVIPPQYSDPYLNDPSLKQFVPPGFTGDRFDLVQKNPLSASAMQSFVQRQSEQNAVEENNYRKIIDQSRRTEDSLKAIAAARKFIATRKLGNDLQAAMKSGLPAEQALVHSLMANPEAWYDHPQVLTSAMKAVRPVTPPMSLPNVAVPITDESGRVLGHAVQSSPNARHIQWERPPAPEGRLTDIEKQTLLELNRQETQIRKNDPPVGKKFQKERDEYNARLADIEAQRQRILKKDTSNSNASTAALPLPKTKDKLEKGVIYQTSKGLGRWNGEKFERVQ